MKPVGAVMRRSAIAGEVGVRVRQIADAELADLAGLDVHARRRAALLVDQPSAMLGVEAHADRAEPRQRGVGAAEDAQLAAVVGAKDRQPRERIAGVDQIAECSAGVRAQPRVRRRHVDEAAVVGGDAARDARVGQRHASVQLPFAGS